MMVHVKKCPIGKRGYQSTEYIINGKEYIYCQGWIYSENDELFEECKSCADHVDKAQSDLDQILKEAMENEHTMSNQEAIEALKRIRDEAIENFIGDWLDYEAFDIAIKALKGVEND